MNYNIYLIISFGLDLRNIRFGLNTQIKILIRHLAQVLIKIN